MALQQSRVFILDRGGQPTFAFEAADAHDAHRMIRSEPLLHALDRFCRARCAGKTGKLQLREATAHESQLYNHMADEFAAPGQQLLIAHLAGR